MKCKKCKKKNRSDANYCIKCGKKFTKEEKDQAEKLYLPTILKKIYDILTLSFITDNLIVRGFYILFILGLGIYMLFSMGSHLRILNNENYEVNYNKNKNTYYIFIDKEKNLNTINAMMYVPNKIDKINLNYYDSKGKLIKKKKNIKKNYINLIINKKENNYYKITGNNKEEIKVYVYYSEVKDENK